MIYGTGKRIGCGTTDLKEVSAGLAQLVARVHGQGPTQERTNRHVHQPWPLRLVLLDKLGAEGAFAGAWSADHHDQPRPIRYVLCIQNVHTNTHTC